MKLYFDDSIIDIFLNDSLLSLKIQQSYRHLQHLLINFKPWDSPYYFDSLTKEQLILRLVNFGQDVGVDVDYQRCFDKDQDYFNAIHKIYEQKYNGNPRWLDFHEHIHLCEQFDSQRLNIKSLVIDYREKAGPLEKKFNTEWMEKTTTQVSAGDVYIQWAELGKTPYAYWKNSEPNEIARMCELAKPWLKLRPKLSIALEDFNFYSKFDIQTFNNWWKEYEQDWCKHWNIAQWGIKEIASVSVIGRVANVDQIKLHLQKQSFPTQIKI
jgi:hypothetical protein